LVEIPIAGLAEELDGYRIVQLSDLHIGNFDTRARGFEWARHANRLDPDLVAVTGDLVTLGTRFYEDVGDVLGELRAKDGVFVSMGNHDQWDPETFCRVIESKGPRVLRNEHRIVRRGSAELVVAGLDDWSTDRDDLDRTLAERPEGAPTVLLSHYPEFFEEAARRDVDLVLSGHTHGGQIGVPFAGRMTLSRFARQRAAGLHERGRSRLYVHAGLGTTGPPMRLGVPPEIAVFVLRRA
jgi:predicted MPP superfamily phosphohydrolase